MIGGAVFLSTRVKAEDPTGVHITVYQTDLMTGAGGSTATVFTDAAGKTIDIVGNPDVFGQGTVPVGTYKRIKFTVKNLINFSGVLATCPTLTTVNTTFRIVNSQPDNAQVPLYFATADDGGSSDWRANGTELYPFLIQNPITVEANGTFIVRLIFNTAGTLICGAGSIPQVVGPTMNAMTYADVPPATGGSCGSLGDYWFFHYRISSYPTDSTGSLIPNPTLTEIMQSGQVVSGWGTVTFIPPSSTGTGTWTIDPTKTYENGGMAEHRHNLYMYSTGSGDGYLNPAGGTVMSAPYLLKGNKMLMTFPGQFTIDGAMSTDCSTFVGVNLDQKEGSDLIVALKKTAATPTFISGSKMVMVGPQINMSYGAAAPIVNYFGYDPGWSAIQINSSPTTSDGKQMEWKNRLEMTPIWSSSTWTIQPPTEDASFSTGLNLNSSMTIAAGGLITQMNGTAPEDFIALGANRNMIMAGEQTDVSVRFPGTHRIAAGMGVRVADSPTLNDIVGKWSIGMLESRVTGTDSWSTGVSYGDMTISIGNTGLAQACGGFTYRDNFSSTIAPPAPGCVQIQLGTECYAGQGVAVTTTPCTSGISVPVFYIMGKGPTGAPQVDTKFVLDYYKNVIVIWNAFDNDDIPCDSGNPGNCTPDPRNKTGAGIGVKIQ